MQDRRGTMLCALIMAGGKGTRFWPLSTEDKPKQFLKLLGEDTMIQMTVKRVEKIIPRERIFIVTASDYVKLIKEQLPYISDRNIIVEPIGKNTAPCITLSAFIIQKYYENATIAVLPSDHLIMNEEEFLNTLCKASEFIEENRQAIVTLGMKPDRPETGYGYIRYTQESSIDKNQEKYSIKHVAEFIEKPGIEKAREYVSKREYLWNGGMFIWKAEHILNLAKEHIQDTYYKLKEIIKYKEDVFCEFLDRRYREVDSISVDYAIMEKAENVYVIPSDFGWDDIGNWSSVERYNPKDEEGNIKNQNMRAYKSKSNIVVTKKKTLLNNVENLIVVETDEYILISSKEGEQEIKLAKQLIS